MGTGVKTCGLGGATSLGLRIFLVRRGVAEEEEAGWLVWGLLCSCRGGGVCWTGVEEGRFSSASALLNDGGG